MSRFPRFLPPGKAKHPLWIPPKNIKISNLESRISVWFSKTSFPREVLEHRLWTTCHTEGHRYFYSESIEQIPSDAFTGFQKLNPLRVDEHLSSWCQFDKERLSLYNVCLPVRPSIILFWTKTAFELRFFLQKSKRASKLMSSWRHRTVTELQNALFDH